MKLTHSIRAGLMLAGLMAAPTDASAHPIHRYASTLDADSHAGLHFGGRLSFLWNRFDLRKQPFYTQPSSVFVPLRSLTPTSGRRASVWQAARLASVQSEIRPLPSQTQQPIPEPGAALAFGMGLLVTGWAWRRR